MSDPHLVLLEYIKDRVDQIAEKVDSHDVRMRSLEETRAEGRGMIRLATVISAAISFAISFFNGHFIHK